MTLNDRWEVYIKLLLYKSTENIKILNEALIELEKMIFAKEVFLMIHVTKNWMHIADQPLFLSSVAKEGLVTMISIYGVVYAVWPLLRA